MRWWFAGGLCWLGGVAFAADPRSVTQPTFKVGDSWVVSQTFEKGTNGFGQRVVDYVVERLNDDTMVVGLKRDGAPGGFEDHEVGYDWSKRHIVDGEQQRTTRPLNFPMHVGQTWSVEYDDTTRRGNQISAHVQRTYKVTGWQDVTVTGGTYHALRLEADGIDTAVIDVPNTAVGGALTSGGGAASFSQARRGGRRQLTVRFYGEQFYVPEVRNFVKSVEEQYNTDDVRLVRETSQLISFKPGG
jgi:hypothetical protein